MKKVYLEEFLDKLSKMVKTSKTEEHKQKCVEYAERYRNNIDNVINNVIFKKLTLDFLDQLIDNIKKEN